MRIAIAAACLSGTLTEKIEASSAAQFKGVEIFENDLQGNTCSRHFCKVDPIVISMPERQILLKDRQLPCVTQGAPLAFSDHSYRGVPRR